MKYCHKFISSLFFVLSVLMILPGLLSSLAFAQQTDLPFELDLSVGGGLIGNSSTNTSFQPEIALSYMPGNWGIGLNSGLYSFESGFNADQYRTGFERFTQSTGDDEKWNAFYVNAGPRYQFGSRLPVKFTAGLDLAMSYQNPPVQQVDFYNPDSEPGVDMQDITLAGMKADDNKKKWDAALRPQMIF